MKRFFLWAILLIVAASCKNSANKSLSPQQAEFEPSDTQPLSLSKPKKINWATIKTATASPVVKSLDISGLPSNHFDATDFKPFSKPVIENNIDYNSLPAKNLDVDKLSIQPLNFKDFILPEPKIIRAAAAHVKNISLSLYELGEIPELQGQGISYLYKDHDGFLWIATFRGLYRYDGENLFQFVAGPMENGTSGILQDKAGRIWVSEYSGGIQVLDIKGGILKKLKVSGGLKSNKVFGMMMDNEQRVWVSYNKGGVDIIDVRNKTVRLLDDTNGLFTKTITVQAVQDKDYNIYIPTFGEGLNIIDLKNKKIRYIAKGHGLGSDSITTVICDRGGKLVIGFADGTLNTLTADKSKIQVIKEAQQHNAAVLSLFEDNKNRIWAGTSKGIEVIDPANKLTRSLTPSDGLSGFFVHKIEEDNTGKMWIADNEGLNIIGNNKIITEHIGKGRVTTLYQDEAGLIWQGTGNGIEIIDLKNKTTKHLGKAQGLGHDSIQTIKGADKRMFVCTNNGLDIIDLNRKTIAHIGRGQGLQNRELYAVMPDKAGRLWLGGDNGIDVYDESNKTIKHIGREEGLSDDHNVDDIKMDSQGQVWVADRLEDLTIIDPVSWNRWYLNTDNGLKVLQPDDKGKMWVGTAKGLYVADLRNNLLTAFSTARVFSLLKQKGQIYAATDGGLAVISPSESNTKGWKFNWFSQAYGVAKMSKGTSFTDMVTNEGTYCWGDEGITFLNLSKTDKFTLPTFITGISIMDEPRYFIDGQQYGEHGRDTLSERDDTLVSAKKRSAKTSNALKKASVWNGVEGSYNLPVNLELPHDQSFIQFHFNNQSLNRRDTTWYRYILHGADAEPNEVINTTSSRNYFNLSPGKYEFEVISKTTDTEWSMPAKFSFTINPPWWQTWWAYLIYVCVFAAFVWCFGYFRSMQLVRDNRALEQKIQLRTEEMVHQKEEIEAQRDSLETVVNQLQNAQSQLVQNEKLASLGELTAGIAHEIQNPLNFVNNFAEVSLEMIEELKEEQNNEVRDPELELDLINNLVLNLEKINHHGKRADAIVKNMLQHSRNNGGERQLTDINALADEYMRLSYHGLRAKDKTFNSEMIAWPHASLPKANVIQQDIGRVLLNMFNNAFYAVHQKKLQNPDKYKPEVTLITLYKRGFIEIRVRDNGIGIPASIKDKIMQPFFTTKPAGQGTGLGLSLSYDIIVKGHGGKLNIDSKEGEYTEFTITLPV